MDLLPIAKWLLPSGVIAWLVRLIDKRLNESRERRILDILERSGQPLSVGIIQTEFIQHVLRDVKHKHITPTLRPGGDPENEADHIPPKTPMGFRLRHWWRVAVKRELPTEENVRDILRTMKGKGFVEFVGNDSWTLRRK